MTRDWQDFESMARDLKSHHPVALYVYPAEPGSLEERPYGVAAWTQFSQLDARPTEVQAKFDPTRFVPEYMTTALLHEYAHVEQAEEVRAAWLRGEEGAEAPYRWVHRVQSGGARLWLEFDAWERARVLAEDYGFVWGEEQERQEGMSMGSYVQGYLFDGLDRDGIRRAR